MGVRGVESKRPDRLRPPSPPSSHTHTHTPLPQHPSLPRGGGALYFLHLLSISIYLSAALGGARSRYTLRHPSPVQPPDAGGGARSGPAPPPRHAQQSTFPSPPPRGITYRNGTGRCYTYARAERGRWELKRILLLSLPELKCVCSRCPFVFYIFLFLN